MDQDRPPVCVHEWKLWAATLGPSGATGWLRCELCGADAPDSGADEVT